MIPSLFFFLEAANVKLRRYGTKAVQDPRFLFLSVQI